MTTNIIKPAVTTNFTVLPNQLLGFGRHVQGLKPRDSSVLNYLLSTPPHWKVIAADIAKAVNISINTVYRALTVLQKLGIVSYTRDKWGYCRWLVSVADTLYSPVTTPHTQKPRVDIGDVLVNTDKQVNNKTTADSGVVREIKAITAPPVNEPTVTSQVEPVELTTEPITVEIAPVEPVQVIDLPEQLTKVEQIVASKSLTKANLDPQSHIVVMAALKTALTTGVARSPLAYLHGLINKAKDGTLDTSKVSNNVSKEVPISRTDRIKALVAKHGDVLLADLVVSGAITVEGLGLVQYNEVKELGLVNSSWIKKHADIELAKLSKLAATIPPLMSFKPLIMPKPMNVVEFEAERWAKVELAMTMMLNQ